ncbi:hypothetical protein AB0873_19695 [Micromonospora sp. NPDC047707]|uniref:hypothetical protein n=1 Tax=Micromonospora sp. NPDC047707 TaxID=3154498 RepID=UPI0034561CCD
MPRAFRPPSAGNPAPQRWSADNPPPGTAYELPDAPSVVAGLTINAAVDSTTVRGNRIWDSQDPRTQAYGSG